MHEEISVRDEGCVILGLSRPDLGREIGNRVQYVCIKVSKLWHRM